MNLLARILSHGFAIAIVLLLFVSFRSMTEVLIIMGTLPTALIGGIWLLYLLGYHLSVAVGVGFIALAGVAVEIGVIMLVYLKQALKEQTRLAREEGRPLASSDLAAAVTKGALLRVRPIMMTVASIVAGLLPIMLGGGTGSEVMRRIAAPMVGGMISSTLLTLVVILFILYARGKPHIASPWKRVFAGRIAAASVVAKVLRDRVMTAWDRRFPAHMAAENEAQVDYRYELGSIDSYFDTLDAEAELDEDILAICDRRGPVAIAGIMGGLDSGVTEQTRDILFESAWFNPATIMGKARRFGMHTDASHRFERGVDPAGQILAVVPGQREAQPDLDAAREAQANRGHGRREGALLAAETVVRGADTVDADADEILVLLEELAPLIREQRPIGLDRVLESHALLPVALLHLNRSAVEVEAHQRRLASLPGDGHHW